jgi:hypothetical protein
VLTLQGGGHKPGRRPLLVSRPLRARTLAEKVPGGTDECSSAELVSEIRLGGNSQEA